MKRDMDLLRKILLVIESEKWDIGIPLKIAGYDERTVAYHVAMLGQAGYLKVGDATENDGFPQAIPISITNLGHDFIEVSNNEKIWAKAKESFMGSAIGVTLDILTDWMKDQVRKQIGLS